jgi:type IV secretory pathway protease TraF
VNGRLAAVRRPRDPRGRIMPSWSGCRVLRSGELFLLSPGVADAFDGRYFGVTRKAELIGKARLLWAKPGGEALG